MSVAVWWALFSLPLFKNVKESTHLSDDNGFTKTMVRSFKEVYSTLIEIRKYKRVGIFLLAYWFYMDGIDTIVRISTAYVTDLGLDALLVVEQ